MKKHVIFSVLILLTALFQNTGGLLPTVFGAAFLPLVPAVVAIGMREGEVAGLIYGMAAGAFWDITSSGADGVHALYLAAFGFAAGLLVKTYLRDTMLSFYVLTVSAALISAVTDWLVFTLAPVGDLGARLLVGFYLPSALLTTAFAFVSRKVFQLAAPD